VTIDVIGAKDSTGVPMIDYTPESEFSIDTRGPTAQIWFSDPVISEQDVGDNHGPLIDVIFSEPVEGIENLYVRFSPDISGTIPGFDSDLWHADTYYTLRCEEELDQNVEIQGIAIIAGGLVDKAGNPMAEQNSGPLFDIDTLNPTVAQITVSDALITDADVRKDFAVRVRYSEPMTTDGTADPVLTFSPEVSATLDRPVSSWGSSSDTFTVVYRVLDADVYVGSVSIDASGGRDAAYNPQQDYTPENEFTIRTRTPTPTVSASHPVIADASAGPAGFTVSVEFHDDMVTNGSADPSFEFSPNVDTTLSGGVGSWGGTTGTFTMTYDVADAEIAIDSVSVDVTGARYAAGGEQADVTPEHEFAIDTENPWIVPNPPGMPAGWGVSTTNGRLTDYDVDRGIGFFVRTFFSEPMDTSILPTYTMSPDVSSSLAPDEIRWPHADFAWASYREIDANIDVDSVTIDVTGARDAAGNPMIPYAPEPEFEIDTLNPAVVVGQAPGQLDPANTAPVLFDVVFDEPIKPQTLAADDVVVGGTAATGAVTLEPATPGSSTDFVISVEVLSDGTVTAEIPAGRAQDLAGNLNIASTSTDNTVAYDGKPSVTIDQASGQPDPTNTPSVRFDAVFNEPIDGATFTGPDVVIGGTATTGSMAIAEIAPYDATAFSIAVAVLSPGTVSASIPAGGVEDLAGNTNHASTSTDNTVTFDDVPPTVIAVSPAALSDADVGAVDVSVAFDETMDASVLPTVTLSGLDPVPCVVSGGSWDGSARIWSGSFLLEDRNQEAVGTFSIGGFRDEAGNPMAPSTAWSVAVDTRNPIVESTVVSDPLLTDSDVGTSFDVVVRFSEAMTTDGSTDPALTFDPDLIGGGAPTLIRTSGSWNGTTDEYTATFDVVDRGLDIETVTIEVAGARDASGNLQQDHTPASLFGIDMANPAPSGIDVTIACVTDQHVGRDFGVLIEFPEPMTTNGTRDPVITFVPDVATTLTFVRGRWLSNTRYEASYRVADSNTVVPDVRIDVEAAADAAGNPSRPLSKEFAFGIDTVSVFVIVPTGGGGELAFLDRGLDLAEGEEPPSIGQRPLAATYAVGETVTGRCEVQDLSGALQQDAYIHAYVYDVQPGDAPSFEPETLSLVSHWVILNDALYGGHRLIWETDGIPAGTYDIHLTSPDALPRTWRIQLVEP